MIKICSVYEKEKKKIINFLKDNHEFKLNDSQYNLLFKNKWTKKKQLGYIIKNDEKIIGFYGILFADKNYYLNNNNAIVNVHTWVVKKKFRYLSLNLINQMNKINGILVSHSTLISLKDIFIKLGWNVLDENFFLIPTDVLSKNKLKFNFLYPKNFREKEIIIDHEQENSKHIRIKINKKELFIIFNLRKKYGITIAEIIHFNNFDSFNKNLNLIRNILFKEFSILLFKIDFRFLNYKNRINYKFFKFKYKTHLKLYKINKKKLNIKKNLITNLYSEFQLLK